MQYSVEVEVCGEGGPRAFWGDSTGAEWGKRLCTHACVCMRFCEGESSSRVRRHSVTGQEVLPTSGKGGEGGGHDYAPLPEASKGLRAVGGSCAPGSIGD